MHQQIHKRNFLQHHSIPILLVQSIPIGCMVALLLLIGSLFVVDLNFGLNDNLAYAEGVDDATAEDTNTDIMPLAEASTSITLSNPTAPASISGNAEPGGVAYASANVTYSASSIADYAVKISLASSSSNPVNGSTTLAGAGGKTVSAMTNNTWGYAWGTTSADETTQTYNTVPAYGSTASVVPTTTADNVNTTGKIMFAAKFASDASPGHYRTSVLLSMVATLKMTYTLSFNADNGTGAPDSQSCTTTSTSCNITISSTKPTRDGYVFQGWADTNDAVTAAYSAGETISMTANKTIYAVWKLPFNGITNMQQMTAAICNSASIGDTAVLTDTRDSSTYTVNKLSDGKCWMTQNLRIINKTITSSNSDVSANFTIPSSALWKNEGADTKHAYYDGDTIYGAYYNWYIVTAGTGTSSMSSGNASNSICPRGWRLPTGGDGGEFKALYDKWAKTTWATIDGKNGRWIGAADIASGGAFFPASGYVWNGTGTLYSPGSESNYWSSTAYDGNATYAYVFNSASYTIGWSNSGNKSDGYSVRCVAR